VVLSFLRHKFRIFFCIPYQFDKRHRSKHRFKCALNLCKVFKNSIFCSFCDRSLIIQVKYGKQSLCKRCGNIHVSSYVIQVHERSFKDFRRNWLIARDIGTVAAVKIGIKQPDRRNIIILANVRKLFKPVYCCVYFYKFWSAKFFDYAFKNTALLFKEVRKRLFFLRKFLLIFKFKTFKRFLCIGRKAGKQKLLGKAVVTLYVIAAYCFREKVVDGLCVYIQNAERFCKIWLNKVILKQNGMRFF